MEKPYRHPVIELIPITCDALAGSDEQKTDNILFEVNGLKSFEADSEWLF